MSFVRVRVTNANLSKITPFVLENPQARRMLENGATVSWDVVGRSACCDNRIELLFSFPEGSTADRTEIVDLFLKDTLQVTMAAGPGRGENIRVYGLA